MSKTRIVCTIGPATETPERIRELIECGMSVARLNGSQADLDWHARTIEKLREIAPEMPILLDIPGRKIRTAQLAKEPEFIKGDILVLTTEPGHDGSTKVSISNECLHAYLSVGDIVLADDGTLKFTVAHIENRDIHVRAENAGQLKSSKGINVPHVRLGGELVTDRDRQMVSFAQENGVDFVGISFVESAEHVETVRDTIGAESPRIVSKVESRGGIDRLDEIAEATDAIMIDRGDLGVQTNIENLALMQKRILTAGLRHCKPVIVATEMLHSMIANPYPTKAEVSDITQAILDGCAAIMLSGETAVGANPLEAVRLMRKVADASESHMHSEEEKKLNFGQDQTVPSAVAEGIAIILKKLPITKIVVFTRTGYAARMLAGQQPRQPILAVCDDPITVRSYNFIRGTEGCYVSAKFSRGSTDYYAEGLQQLWLSGKIDMNDFIVVTGRGYPNYGNRMNVFQLHHVSDLAEALDWRAAI